MDSSHNSASLDPKDNSPPRRPMTVGSGLISQEKSAPRTVPFFAHPGVGVTGVRPTWASADRLLLDCTGPHVASQSIDA